MNLKLQIQAQYELDSIIKFKKLYKGKTSTTLYLQTLLQEEYIVKSLVSVKSAKFEYSLLEHIKNDAAHLVSEILLSIHNEPFIIENDTVFQLQKFKESQSINPSLEKWVQSYHELQRSFQTFHYSGKPLDRFSLLYLWKLGQANLQKFYPVIHDELMLYIEDLITLDQQTDCWIHGDLGSWNVLNSKDSDGVIFIDFSEARKGPKYFDLAALLTSFAPTNKGDLLAYVNDFIQVYSKIDALNKQLLHKTIELWFVRGILLGLLKEMDKSVITYFKNMKDTYTQVFCSFE